MVPISTLHDEFMLLFEEPEKAISSEYKATENKEDELEKIIDDVMKDMENKPPSSNEPPSSRETTK